MLRLITLLFWLTVGLLVVVFTAPNLHPVALHYYLGSSELPLAVVLLICLWLGALLGVLFSYRRIFALRQEIRRLRKSERSGEAV